MNSQTTYQRIVVRIAGVGVLALAAALVSTIAVRTPESWPAIPNFFFKWSELLLKPATQEQYADAEFFGIWLAIFCLMCAAAAAALAAHAAFLKGCRYLRLD